MPFSTHPLSSLKYNYKLLVCLVLYIFLLLQLDLELLISKVMDIDFS